MLLYGMQPKLDCTQYAGLKWRTTRYEKGWVVSPLLKQINTSNAINIFILLNLSVSEWYILFNYLEWHGEKVQSQCGLI